MTDWENIELLLAEAVGPNHEEEITTGTEENKRVVKELYGAFGRGDIAAVRALLAEDVIWHLPGTVPHYSGTYQGRSSVAVFFQKLYANVGIEAFEPREFVAEADRVLVIGWSRGRVKNTGRTFENRWVMAFSVRDGRIAKFDEYADTQALAAAHDASYRAAPWMHST
jgi:ketosteroid isomerase-like protein